MQLNFPPQEASKLADAVAVGDQITAEGRPERAKADHAVCRLEKLTTAKGTEIAIEGPPRPRGREGAGPADRGPYGERTPVKTESLIGIVKYLNHGPRGEVDGAVLESGDFLHIGPREAEEAKLEVGKEISVEGQSLKMPDGHTMIEHPTKINGKEVSRLPSADAVAARPPRPGGIARRNSRTAGAGDCIGSEREAEQRRSKSQCCNFL